MSDELPIAGIIIAGHTLGIADGPTEVHKVTLARILLGEAEPSPGLFPTAHLPTRRAQALEKYADVLARYGRAPYTDAVGGQ